MCFSFAVCFLPVSVEWFSVKTAHKMGRYILLAHLLMVDMEYTVVTFVA